MTDDVSTETEREGQDFASALGGTVGGTIKGRVWFCADCPKSGFATTEPEASKALYRHRQIARHAIGPTMTDSDPTTPTAGDEGAPVRANEEDFALPDVGPLVQAVAEVCWKATPMYLPDGEDVNYYMVPKGTLHRLVGIGQVFGSVALRNGAMDAAIKAKLDAGKPEDAELIATNQLLRAALRIAHDDMEAMYQAVQRTPRRQVTVPEDSWEKGVFEGSGK